MAESKKGKKPLLKFYDALERGLYTLLILSLVLATLFIFYEIFISWPYYLKTEGGLLNFVFFVLDRSLLALMLLEILHTIKISLEGPIKIAIEPFLMIGIIASVRRILIISVEIAHPPAGCEASPELFKQYMMESALLVVLILSFVAGIILLRRCLGRGVVKKTE
jgi:hypothetical protein